MAHFTQLDANNVVARVIVVHNNELMLDGVESEDKGVLFCKSLFGPETRWRQTSYNGTRRKNYAGVGYSYDAQRDAFIPPKPYASWLLDEDTCLWGAPTPYPADGKAYAWSEDMQQWTEMGEPTA